MKYGMLFECGPMGADLMVCTHLAKMLRPEVQIVPVTLDNKPKMIERCGEACASLIAEGCEQVIIVWDLYPPWRDTRPSRDEDRSRIYQSLERAAVSLDNVHLVCITEELEAWLLADGRALSAVFSRGGRNIQVPHNKKSDRVQNPKQKLDKMFRENIGIRYSDIKHAAWIVKALPDLERLQRICSFERYSTKLCE
jgi:hypothetical protein